MASHEILSKAASSYGFDVETLTWISHTTNEVYRFAKDAKPYILRLSAKPAEDANNIEAEVRWIRYLAENGVQASLPILTTDGRLTAICKDKEHCAIATAFEWAPGVTFNQAPQLWGPSLFRQWGALMGKMHRLTKSYTPWDSDRMRAGWSPAQIDNPYLREGDYRILLDRLRSHERNLANLPIDDRSYGLIHHDFHPYNFHIEQGSMTVFDFDDAIYGWFALDIGIAAAHAVWWGSPEQDRHSKRAFAERFMDAFLTGYLKENALDPFWIQQIPVFMDYRNISSYFWWLSGWDGEEGRLSEVQKRAIAYAASLIQQDLPFDGCDIRL